MEKKKRRRDHGERKKKTHTHTLQRPCQAQDSSGQTNSSPNQSKSAPILLSCKLDGDLGELLSPKHFSLTLFDVEVLCMLRSSRTRCHDAKVQLG